MNREDVPRVANLLDDIDQLAIGQSIAAQFKDKDLESVVWQEITSLEFAGLVSRTVLQLRAEVERNRLRFYPTNFPSEIGGYQNRNIVQCLHQLHSSIHSANWPEAAVYLRLLIDYQIFCGFWDRGERTLHSVPKLRRAELLKNLETRQTHVEALATDVKRALAGLQEALGNLRATQDEVAQLLGAIRKSSDEATSLVAQARGNEGKLEEIIKTQDNHKRVTEEFLLRIDAHNVYFEKAVTAADVHLAKGKDTLAWIKEKEALVNEIAGTAAAGALGQKFEARRRELGKVCIGWLFVLVAALGASGWWLWFVHTNFHLQNGNIWMELASNFGLMLPAVFLLIFVTAQYLKERHFQEEYAFRASVAMTMKAFADELVAGNGDRNQVLRETIQKLYQLPSGLMGKDEESPLLAARATTHVIKGVLQVLREAKK